MLSVSCMCIVVVRAIMYVVNNIPDIHACMHKITLNLHRVNGDPIINPRGDDITILHICKS